MPFFTKTVPIVDAIYPIETPKPIETTPTNGYRITKSHLTAMGVKNNVEEWVGYINKYTAIYNINNKLTVAAFLANILHETGNLVRLRESLNYDYAGIRATFGRHRISDEDARKYCRLETKVNGKTVVTRPADQIMIANLVYGGQFGLEQLGNTQYGDGSKFIGRGGMQTTGKSNYIHTAEELGVTVEELIILLEQPEFAIKSACYFFEKSRCIIPANRGDIARVRRILNGGKIGLEDVEKKYAQLMRLLP